MRFTQAGRGPRVGVCQQSPRIRALRAAWLVADPTRAAAAGGRASVQLPCARLCTDRRLCSPGACLHAAWPPGAASFPPCPPWLVPLGASTRSWSARRLSSADTHSPAPSAPPLSGRSRAERLNAFLEYAVQQPGVFLVTVTQVLDWMKNPGEALPCPALPLFVISPN